ncbi:MAG TPA: efflux RND transporter periplasmic adaptor subunit [Vicinamibacteria bacterium]|nr:efflux RND transporter periplasmic adaptor subunit [Vicinamibacteria bacterium]
MKRIVVFALCGAAAVAQLACGEKTGPAAAPPEVYVSEVTQRDVPVYMELVGQTRGAQDIDIRARVEGYLDKVAFTEGTFVHKGDLLYQIDPKAYEATLANAKADLATAQARLTKTNTDVSRLTPLAKQQAVSQQELDNAVAFQEAARAQVDAQKAAVDKAALDLGYTHVTSPIDGLAGTTQVKAGALVGRGESTLLTTVSAVDPILFRAGISEAEALRIAKRVQDTGHRLRDTVVVDLVLADGTVHAHKGRIDTVERAVDPTTGTLMVQFSFPNPEKVLRPGLYGRARFVSETRAGALLVPQRAVSELQNLYSVAVVGEGNKVAFRNVKVGPRVESLWVIDEGLKPGEKVVVEGLQRLRDGVVVSPKPVEAAKVATTSAAAEAK